MEIEDINACITLFKIEKEPWMQSYPEFFFIGTQRILIKTTSE